MNPSLHPKIKFCGITRTEDAQAAQKLGIWAVGMIFYSKSPRCITLDAARETVKNSGGLEKIGVFVHPTLEQVLQTARGAGLTAIQLHGDETVEFCRQVKANAIPVIKVFRLQSEQDLKKIETYRGVVDFILIDGVTESWGGSGALSNWDLAAQAALLAPLILAGGLTVDNVAAAIKKVKPFALDVSSGIETSPGIKDSEKMKSFREAVQNAT